MFRSRTKLFKHTNGKSSEVFDEDFWQSYSDNSSSNDTNETSAGNNHKNILKKHRSTSKQVLVIQKYFHTLKLPIPSNNQVSALLKSPFSLGDVTATFHLIRFFQLSSHGFFLTNESHDKLGNEIGLKGAVNWENVMCYLDALLFSMFANLESFEPILYISKKHDDPLIDRLSALLRLYISLLRSGHLITTDVTQRICETLSSLGFTEAMSHKQQDSAALFEFLTEKLAMPLLTFKIDIKHGGKYNKEDDEKYSKERMLFVSIPDEDSYSEKVDETHVEDADTVRKMNTDDILLEECLEHYFNNSVSVKRELERRATLESVKDRQGFNVSKDSPIGFGKPLFNQDLRGSVSYVDEPNTAVNTTRASRSNSKDPIKVTTRTRSSTISLWSSNGVDDSGKSKEVSLPAWMFLRLLPFYTDDNLDATNVHSMGAKSSKEFVNRRPILPICLKRYSFNTKDSKASRSSRRIIIPPIIDLPQFVADEVNDDVSGDYSLILESAICHRGTTITSGHFVSAVRKRESTALNTEEAHKEPWYLYDDMNMSSRVVQKSFEEIFSSEWPYMLFYRLIASNEQMPGVQSDNATRFPSDINKSITRIKGTNSRYWNQNILSPVVSISNMTSLKSGHESLKTKERSTSNESLPTPKLLPTDAKFIDIKNKYFWYVADKKQNYHKEVDNSCFNNKEEILMKETLRQNDEKNVREESSYMELDKELDEYSSYKKHENKDKSENNDESENKDDVENSDGIENKDVLIPSLDVERGIQNSKLAGLPSGEETNKTFEESKHNTQANSMDDVHDKTRKHDYKNVEKVGSIKRNGSQKRGLSDSSHHKSKQHDAHQKANCVLF